MCFYAIRPKASTSSWSWNALATWSATRWESQEPAAWLGGGAPETKT